MIEQNDLLEPKKLYNEVLKEAHAKNADELFNKLTKESGVDVEANAHTVSEFNKTQKEAEQINKKLGNKKVLKAFIIFLIILFITSGVLCTVYGAMHAEDLWVLILIGIGCLLIGAGFIVLQVLVIRKNINELRTRLSRLIDHASELKAEAYMQMSSLNALYDFNMHAGLVHSTIPLLDMDKYFNMEKFEYLCTKFGYSPNTDHDHSTVHVQSGSILGNPFVIETVKTKDMGMQTYEGSLTYTYTVRVKSKNGYTTQRRTDTLRATVTKPKPFYNYEKWLYYGCEAAPKLRFSRVPCGVKEGNKDSFAKYVKSEEKKLNKYAEKNLDKGFTPLANTEFETLFHAWDRDNEQQFRLLFTPLAQRNIVDLIKGDGGYGDDFTFRKEGMLNVVQTKHSLTHDYVGSPDMFVDYDYERAKDKFINYNCEYFRSFYFDLAPLMSIPLYQQLPTDEYIFEHKFRYNVSPQEAESTVNTFDKKVFEPKDNQTELILKSNYIMSEGNADRVMVHAYGHATEPRVDYVPKMGKDGHWHNVPVHWIEYIPIDSETPVEIVRKEVSRQSLNKTAKTENYKNFVKNNTVSYRNGYFAFVVNNMKDRFVTNEIDNIFEE